MRVAVIGSRSLSVANLGDYLLDVSHTIKIT